MTLRSRRRRSRTSMPSLVIARSSSSTASGRCRTASHLLEASPCPSAPLSSRARNPCPSPSPPRAGRSSPPPRVLPRRRRSAWCMMRTCRSGCPATATSACAIWTRTGPFPPRPRTRRARTPSRRRSSWPRTRGAASSTTRSETAGQPRAGLTGPPYHPRQECPSCARPCPLNRTVSPPRTWPCTRRKSRRHLWASLTASWPTSRARSGAPSASSRPTWVLTWARRRRWGSRCSTRCSRRTARRAPRSTPARWRKLDSSIMRRRGARARLLVAVARRLVGAAKVRDGGDLDLSSKASQNLELGAELRT
mmetsp:Transcript_5904/g.16098  ORF Transcript_5904/g.16098 Transcript_5904/m.16098 type:complete len:308 (+) Transcript_5904:160-1083(+)